MRDAPLPVVHAAAPLRLDLAGSGGLAAVAGRPAASLSFALELSAHAEVRLGGKSIRVGAVETGEHVAISSPADISYDGCLDRHKAALNMLPVTGGLELLTSRDAPEGAGLGGGAASVVAMLGALAHCRRENPDPLELADLAATLETAELRRPAPLLDIWSAVRGGLCELRTDGAEVTTERVVGEAEAVRELQARLLLAPLDRARAGGIRGRATVAAVQASDGRTLAAVQELEDLVRPAAQAVARGAWRELEEIFAATWEVQQRLDPVLGAGPARALTDALRAAGAWAWKVTSGRRGGSMVVLCEPGSCNALADALRASGCTPVSLAVGAAARVWEELA